MSNQLLRYRIPGRGHFALLVLAVFTQPGGSDATEPNDLKLRIDAIKAEIINLRNRTQNELPAIRASLHELNTIVASTALEAKSAKATELLATTQQHADGTTAYRDLDLETTNAWDAAEVRELQARERRRVQEAQFAESDVHVRQFQQELEVAETEANRDYARKFLVRQANSAHDRTPAPFVFASPAHFPIREFGQRGEILEREGAIIYEDMQLSFANDGGYHLEFRLEAPRVPIDLRLQLQFRPMGIDRWSSITLAPIRFEPNEGGRETQSRRTVQEYKISGHSLDIARYYGQLGGADFRRTGNARFGYGSATRGTSDR
ncbi:MAG: hypothetical protein H8E66_02025 [Planctomycetes bacterium]|nr:hypothetical protein [Planctomycetota bacterium]